MVKKLTMILAGLFLSIGIATAQTQISGTVVSEEDGEPIIGASVLVEGTSVGAATDIDGKFTLTLPAGKSKLRISYIGMETQEVTARNGMVVRLVSDSKALDEVIVVAFGQAKKSAFTGSAAVVTSEKIQAHTTSNVANTLVGSVPGLQMRGSSGAPGAGAGSMNVRGISSLYAGTDPLIIVDGAPYTASLSNIPTSDIESVTVLKDAASAALYGARGASGVILVTTKKGKSHDAIINVDMKWGANSRAIQDYDVISTPQEYMEAYYALRYNQRFYGQGYSAAAANDWANSQTLKDLSYNIFNVPDGEMLIGMNGKINPNATIGRSYLAETGETFYMQPDDWTKLAYSNALRQEYNVSANAANERGSFYASLGYLNEDGIIEYSGFERISARVRADYQLKKWLKLGANVNFVHSHTTSNPNMSTDWGSTNLMYYTSMIAPIYPVYVRVLDANGNPVIRTDEFGNQQYDYGIGNTNYYGYDRPFLSTGNPLGSNRYNKVYSNGNQFNGSFNVDIMLFPWLKFNNTSTAILGQTSYSNYQNPFYGPKAGVNGEITKYQSNTMRQNHVQTLTYFNKFGEHDIQVMLGHEYYYTKTKYLEAARTGGFSPEIPELNAFATMSGSKSYTSRYNVEGYFGNAQYNYMQKYFASASYRRDASSYFAKENRWGDFWSVGAAWIISKESFMESTKSWLDMLKLKVSIGQQGNDNIGNWAYIDLYSLSKSSDTSMAPSFYRVGNKDITWETTTNFNVGLEFELWKGRLVGNLDVYSKKTTDLLFWLSIPESAGSRGYYGNVGDIRNSGIELELTGHIVRTKDVNWSVTANLAHNSTKILKLPASKITENGGFYESGYWYAEGQPMYNNMSYVYAGVNEQGEALYYYDANLSPAGGTVAVNNISKAATEKSGTTTNIGEASRYATGCVLPKLFGGFSTMFRWKNFDASVTFDYQLGGKVWDSRYQNLMSPPTDASNAGRNYHKDWVKAWTPNNTDSDIPRWQFGDQYSAASSDRWLTNASYLNFQSFNVGYTLPKNLTNRIKISTIRIYCAGENLIFWSARKGLDPRYSFDGNTSVNVYSPVRTISGGIQLTF
ncbi:MAG: TonB-dependent receptor [Prevotella sp.]|nr:TonB-dependent receptor [Prevotella sp.]